MFNLMFFVRMTHYYYFIQSGQMLDASAKFYRVGIGQSKAESRIKDKLQRYAAEHGYYFAICNSDTDTFWQKCLKSVNAPSTTVIYISGRNLLKELRAGTQPALIPSSLHNQHQMMLTLNLDYRISSRIAANR